MIQDDVIKDETQDAAPSRGADPGPPSSRPAPTSTAAAPSAAATSPASPASPAPPGADAGAASRRRRRFATTSLGLPAKLLILTTLFVMLAEVLIFVPSVANFRINWLNDRLTAARLAALAADAAPGGTVPTPVREDLLRTAEVKAVAIRRDGIRRLVLPPDRELAIAASFDQRPMSTGKLSDELMMRLSQIGEAMMVFLEGDERIIRIIGPLAPGPDDFIEVVVPERPLYDAMVQFGLNILLLSIIISLFTAALVYVALSNLLVRPMMRLSRNMVHFADNPEDASRIITPSDRTDEIGTAERELAGMQHQLASLLLQKNRLAQLGLAVSKINHDLRNMLANAQLLSDRLSDLPDPTVQRFAPKLIASLDRAISFCNDTLRYGRAEEAAPRRALIPLAPLVREVADGLALPREGELRPTPSRETRIDLTIDIPPRLTIDADPDHLYRVLSNLCRNAVQVLEANGPGPAAPRDAAAKIEITAAREGRRVVIEVHDNGPGLPPRARENIFRAFQGSTRKGGTGLGLVIAAELVAAHGGQLRLLDTAPGEGAAFEIVVPDRLTV